MRSGEFDVNGSTRAVHVTPQGLHLGQPRAAVFDLDDVSNAVLGFAALGLAIGGLVVLDTPVRWLGWALLGLAAACLLVLVGMWLATVFAVVAGVGQLLWRLVSRSGRRELREGAGRQVDSLARAWRDNGPRTVAYDGVTVEPVEGAGRRSFVISTTDGPLVVRGSRVRRDELDDLHRQVATAVAHQQR